MQNDRLLVLFRGRNINLQIDDTVACVSCVRDTHRVVVDLVHLASRSAVLFAVDHLRITLAYIDLLCALRGCFDSQVQAIDAVGVVHRRVAVFVLLGLTDRMLQRVSCVVLRTVQPVEGQIRLADSGVFFEQIGGIDDQH